MDQINVCIVRKYPVSRIQRHALDYVVRKGISKVQRNVIARSLGINCAQPASSCVIDQNAALSSARETRQCLQGQPRVRRFRP